MNPSLDRETTNSRKRLESSEGRTSRAPTFLRGDWAAWRSRAIAYTLSFALLALLLVGLRYLTRDLGPTLRELRSEEAALLEQVGSLTVEAQTLTSPVRVREFALSSGMVPFSKVPKEAHTFVALPRTTLPKNTLPQNTLEVETRWR